MPKPHLQRSDLIGLKWDPETNNCKDTLDDPNVGPSLGTTSLHKRPAQFATLKELLGKEKFIYLEKISLILFFRF